MLLAQKLPPSEIERHVRLIKDYAKNSFGSEEVDIELLGNGAEKGVYKVKYSDGLFVASAAAINPERKLLEEYNILHELFQEVPTLFPKPLSHYSSQKNGLGELITMELLPHKDLNLLRNSGVSSFYRDLAREIGMGVGKVNLRTGRYSSEPHDGNILGRFENGKIEIKFCDAIQFRKGDIGDAVQSILSSPEVRPECFRFIKQFREGLAQAELEENPEEDKTKIENKYEFLRRYNDIF
jgi:hypothetical protein